MTGSQLEELVDYLRPLRPFPAPAPARCPAAGPFTVPIDIHQRKQKGTVLLADRAYLNDTELQVNPDDLAGD